MISHSLNILFKWIKDVGQLIRFSGLTRQLRQYVRVKLALFSLWSGECCVPACWYTVIHSNPQGFGQD